ncbi:MAG: serine/threonine-protein kinase [Deltaproteobacteria bacterium]|nr:serine/threonine-protein kinase [Deltaproteobacteria bacterium]
MLSVVEGFPRHFGRFLLLTSFGRGGMGEVYLGKQRIGDAFRLCVVKTLRGDLADHREYVGRFLDEARVVVQLSHAHISQVYEAGVVGTDHFLAMEFIHGLNLKEVLGDLTERQQRLDPGLAVHVVATTLDALGYAHRLESPTTGAPLRVVHRDVSPANVMVSFEGEVKLIDFGLAESALKTEVTETRLVMGKVAYMAPEQARGEDVDGACDQFSCGLMLYEAVTGDRFYGDMNTHQIWQVVGHGGFVPRSWFKVPEELRPVLARALDKDATKRFPSCEAFRDALDDVRATLWPRSGKAQLRELLSGLYSARVAQERALIASFASLAPPEPGASADFGRMPLTEPAGSPSTEPFLTSSSRPNGDPLGLSVTRGSAVHDTTVTPVTSPTSAPPAELTASVLRGTVELREGFTDPRRPADVVVAASDPSAAMAVPSNSMARLVGAVAAGVIAVAVVAVGIISSAEEPAVVVVDAGPLVAALPVVAPAIVPALVPVEDVVVVDAGVAAIALVRQKTPKKTVVVEPTPPPVVPVVVPVAVPVAVPPPVRPPVDVVKPPPPPPPPPPKPPAARTMAEDLATLRSCPLEGAKKARALVDATPEKQQAGKALIQLWAGKCRGL